MARVWRVVLKEYGERKWGPSCSMLLSVHSTMKNIIFIARFTELWSDDKVANRSRKGYAITNGPEHDLKLLGPPETSYLCTGKT
jgi:hypothetical protein